MYLLTKSDPLREGTNKGNERDKIKMFFDSKTNLVEEKDVTLQAKYDKRR